MSCSWNLGSIGNNTVPWPAPLTGTSGSSNFEYANRLETHRLRPMIVREIPAGTWVAYRSARIGRLGGSLEQYKHPCLVSDLDFIDKLKELNAHAGVASP